MPGHGEKQELTLRRESKTVPICTKQAGSRARKQGKEMFADPGSCVVIKKTVRHESHFFILFILR